MQIRNGKALFSASDLVNYLECGHLTALDLVNLETPLQRAAADDQAKLIQDKGYEHEEAYLANLQATTVDVVDVKVEHFNSGDLLDFEATIYGYA